MILHRHAPTLENLLIRLPHRTIRGLLIRKLDISETLAQAADVGDDAGVGDGAEAGEFRFELGRGDFEEEVADVEDAGGFGCPVAVLAGEDAGVEGLGAWFAGSEILGGG